jgi:hypothetical protein
VGEQQAGGGGGGETVGGDLLFQFRQQFPDAGVAEKPVAEFFFHHRVEPLNRLVPAAGLMGSRFPGLSGELPDGPPQRG